MKWALVVALLVSVAAAMMVDPTRMHIRTRPVLTQELVDTINDAGHWKADLNQGSNVHGLTEAEARAMCGSLPGGPVLPLKFESDNDLLRDLPANFNAIDNWPQCPTIADIRDQSACGSCWAIAAVEAMSDRSCIHLNKQLVLSTSGMTFCCTSCGYGCEGGYPSSAWQYYQKVGVVEEECYPYPFPSCDHHVENSTNPCPKPYNTPKCANKCTNANWSGPEWKENLHHGATSYAVRGEQQIMADILKNGPVEGSFTVYEDFLAYKSGVYRHVTGKALGGHAIKILGWGTTDAGEKYWIIANSWNRNWGNGGYIWMRRGANECGIENQAVAGIPKD